jgi:hypothetical protein
MLMKRLSIAFGLVLVATAISARADNAARLGCVLASADAGKNEVTIGCSGPSVAVGKQLAEVLTRILQSRLDPKMVLVKLDELSQVPREGVARTLDADQRRLIIQSLNGKPAQQVAITAHPAVADSAAFAEALAAPLLMVGWHIEGNEIRRVTLKSLHQMRGVAVVVHDRAAAPPKALELQAALAAGHVIAPLVSDPDLPLDAALLWVGQRPQPAQPRPPR